VRISINSLTESESYHQKSNTPPRTVSSTAHHAKRCQSSIWPPKRVRKRPKAVANGWLLAVVRKFSHATQGANKETRRPRREPEIHQPAQPQVRRAKESYREHRESQASPATATQSRNAHGSYCTALQAAALALRLEAPRGASRLAPIINS